MREKETVKTRKICVRSDGVPLETKHLQDDIHNYKYLWYILTRSTIPKTQKKKSRTHKTLYTSCLSLYKFLLLVACQGGL